ncbi:MAG: MarR family winged helix-turn-helix transcriptional regulator [Oscillospiraceae bacterium]
MKDYENQLNDFLVTVFNDILKTEEQCLAKDLPDLSLRELHVVEAVCAASEGKGDDRAAAIAAALRVTAGSLTIMVTALEKKGYLERRRDGADRRGIHLVPTGRGLEAGAIHREFHKNMVAGICETLPEQDLEGLVQGLTRLADFFETSKEN